MNLDVGDVCGCITSDLPLSEKAQAYVDLLLAPTGEAALAGEPAAIINNLQSTEKASLDHCTADDLEILAAICGLMLNVAAQPSGRDSVLNAFEGRSDAFSTLCCFVAFPPSLSAGNDKKRIESIRVDFKNAQNLAAEQLPQSLTPAQDSEAYLKVMSCCVRIFMLLATSEIASELCESRHFDKGTLRLVELVGRYRPPISEDRKCLAECQLAVVSRDALCAITSFGTDAACAFVHEAHHPFLPSVSAESLISSVRTPSSIAFSPKPLRDLERINALRASNTESGEEHAKDAQPKTAHWFNLLGVVSLSVLSRWYTGHWLAPLATASTIWPWLASFLVLPPSLDLLTIPIGCFSGIPAESMGLLSRIGMSLILTIPTFFAFETIPKGHLVKYCMPARMKSVLGYT